MNIIPQLSLFGEGEFEELGDLERLQTLLGAIPDERLISKLYKIRGNGRLDRDYKFEKHSIRGLEKMKMFVSVSFLLYLSLAKAKIERGQKEHLCKLYA